MSGEQQSMSYKRWWQDLNPQPLGSKPSALSIELHQLTCNTCMIAESFPAVNHLSRTRQGSLKVVKLSRKECCLCSLQAWLSDF
jgi:hypothetical protein